MCNKNKFRFIGSIERNDFERILCARKRNGSEPERDRALLTFFFPKSFFGEPFQVGPCWSVNASLWATKSGGFNFSEKMWHSFEPTQNWNRFEAYTHSTTSNELIAETIRTVTKSTKCSPSEPCLKAPAILQICIRAVSSICFFQNLVAFLVAWSALEQNRLTPTARSCARPPRAYKGPPVLRPSAVEFSEQQSNSSSSSSSSSIFLLMKLALIIGTHCG